METLYFTKKNRLGWKFYISPKYIRLRQKNYISLKNGLRQKNIFHRITYITHTASWTSRIKHNKNWSLGNYTSTTSNASTMTNNFFFIYTIYKKPSTSSTFLQRRIYHLNAIYHVEDVYDTHNNRKHTDGSTSRIKNPDKESYLNVLRRKFVIASLFILFKGLALDLI